MLNHLLKDSFIIQRVESQIIGRVKDFGEF